MIDRVRAIRHISTLSITTIMLGAAGCSGEVPQANQEATQTPSLPATSAPTTSSEPEPAPTTMTDTSTATSVTGDGELEPGAEGRRLTLEDFFNPDSSWREQRYNIADQKDVAGIAAEVSGCTSTPESLELRLGNNFESLSFAAAQANDSESSDQVLSVRVVANNEQVEIRNIPFNEVQDFTVPVTGVNALKIEMVMEDEGASCQGSVNAVLISPELS
jgi:hypothetical protein